MKDIFAEMNSFKAPFPLTLPPPAFEDLKGEFVEYIPGESMKAKFAL